jgi:hypothetical protein
MMAFAQAAAMTTPVEYRDVDMTATTEFSPIVLVGSRWEAEVVGRVLELERLRANWDGYGSPPVSRDTSTVALELIGLIGRTGIENLPVPFVGPVPGGGVSFEWAVGSRQLTVTVHADGEITYLQWESHEQFQEGELDLRSLARLTELARWLGSSA